MFNVVVEIKAPEIVEAIKSLVGAIAGVKPVENTPVQAPQYTPPMPEQQPQMQQPQMEMQPQYPNPGYAPQQQMPQATVVQAPIQQTPQAPQPPIQQAPIQQPQAPAAVPTAAQTYTMEQLAVAATQLMDAGRKNDLMGLLSSFGVRALTQLPKEQYGNFATQLRSMGAKI